MSGGYLVVGDPIDHIDAALFHALTQRATVGLRTIVVDRWTTAVANRLEFQLSPKLLLNCPELCRELDCIPDIRRHNAAHSRTVARSLHPRIPRTQVNDRRVSIAPLARSNC